MDLRIGTVLPRAPHRSPCRCACRRLTRGRGRCRTTCCTSRCTRTRPRRAATTTRTRTRTRTRTNRPGAGARAARASAQYTSLLTPRLSRRNTTPPPVPAHGPARLHAARRGRPRACSRNPAAAQTPSGLGEGPDGVEGGGPHGVHQRGGVVLAKGLLEVRLGLPAPPRPSAPRGARGGGAARAEAGREEEAPLAARRRAGRAGSPRASLRRQLKKLILGVTKCSPHSRRSGRLKTKRTN